MAVVLQNTSIALAIAVFLKVGGAPPAVWGGGARNTLSHADHVERISSTQYLIKWTIVSYNQRHVIF